MLRSQLPGPLPLIRTLGDGKICPVLEKIAYADSWHYQHLVRDLINQDQPGQKREGGSLNPNQQPKIIHLNMLDTDYASLVAGEPIAPERRQRLAQDHYDVDKLSQYIARYRYGGLDQQGQDDVLCTIATLAGLFSLADVEDINDRLRYTGRFYLTQGERQQVRNWLVDELDIWLDQPHPG